MRTRDALLAATILCGFLVLTKVAQISLTPEFWNWTQTAGRALLKSPALRLLVIVFGFLFLGSLVAAGFDTSVRRNRRRLAERARARAIREEQVRQALADPIDTTTDSGRPAA